jgi:acetyl esterase
MFDEDTREIPWVAPSTGRLDPDAQAMAELSALFDATPLAQIGVQRLRALMPGRPCGPVHERRDALIDLPGRQVAVRIYRPSADDGLPVLVFFHGGGWVIGTLDAYDQMCSEIALAGGCIVVSVDYRLAPEHPFPAAVDDAYLATAWIARHAADLGGHPRRVAVGGDSAGANLAAVTSCMAAQLGGPALVFQLLIYPGFDPDSTRPAVHENGGGPGLTQEASQWFWSQYLDQADHSRSPFVNPLLAPDLSGLPPALIVTAEYDLNRDDGEVYGELLRAAGGQAEVRRYPGVQHGFLTYTDTVVRAVMARDDIGDRLRTVFASRLAAT